MGGKSVGHRAAMHKARQMMRHMSMKEQMEEKAAQERTPPFTGEVTCAKCGFKARYQFVRCPECNEVRK